MKLNLPSGATVALLETRGIGVFTDEGFVELSEEDARELCVQLNCHFARTWSQSFEGRAVLAARKEKLAAKKASREEPEEPSLA